MDARSSQNQYERLPGNDDFPACCHELRFPPRTPCTVEWNAGCAATRLCDSKSRALRAGRSNAELAAKVGLSASPCLRRVRRLEETGVIRGYRALIDPAAIGRSLRVFVGVRLMRHARSSRTGITRVTLLLYVTQVRI
jgi:hypothetical protein